MLMVPLKKHGLPRFLVLCFLLTIFWIWRTFHGAIRTKDITTKISMDQANRTDTLILTPIDKLYYNKYLKYKKLEQFSETLAYLSKSRVRILNTDNSSFKVGDTIRIRIELYNVSGDLITIGGDFIKIWMQDTDKKAGSTGYVIDHGNGSYTGVIRALWSGTPVIKISHSLTKEAIGLFVNYLREHETYFKMFGVFKNSHGETGKGICGPHQHIGDSICDLTSLNYGMRWYCTLPENYICGDRYGPYTGLQTSFTNRKLRFSRDNSNRILKEIQISVKGGTITNPGSSCSKERASSTWNNSSPVGFFYRNVWQSLLCKDSLPHDVKNYKKCLENRKIYMFGDSTLRVWLVSMVKILDLNLTLGPKHILSGRPWHRPVTAKSKPLKGDNISVMWMPHEVPFLTSMHGAVYDDFKAPTYYLENITSKNPIIILHWYLHLVITLPSVFQEHVQNAKTAIIKFLKRTPDAKIFIKGPHNVVTSTFPGIPRDFTRFYTEDILFREFQDLNDKVFFLNEWDVTVASESTETHPSENINRQMIHNFLTLIC